jgi:hypothetical protein
VKPNFNSVVGFPYTAESYEASELKDFHTHLSHKRLPMDGALVTVGSLYLKEERSLPPQVICTSTVVYLPTHFVFY